MFALNLLGFLRDWRTLLAIGCAALIGWFALSAKLANDRADRAQAQAAAQARQAHLNEASRQSVERYVHETKIIREKAEEAVKDVRQAPGADDEFAVRDELCAALQRLRNGEPACTDPGPGDLPR